MPSTSLSHSLSWLRRRREHRLMATLVITPALEEGFNRLRLRAVQNPIDMRDFDAMDAEAIAAHRARLLRQSLVIRAGSDYMVTFSIETGHPVGMCRHVSVSRVRDASQSLPAVQIVWALAQLLGFTGCICECVCFPEQLENGGQAINVVQVVAVDAVGRA